MKRLFYIFALTLFPLVLSAETKSQSMVWNHELRIGWGDQLFESVAWHNPTSYIRTLPEEYRAVYNENYRYDQHLWLEYMYGASHWFSIGLKVDLSDVRWDEVTRNGRGEIVSSEGGHFFYNAAVLPVMRFTYFRLDWLNLYLGLGAGLGINGGTEVNSEGKKTDFGVAADVTLLGVSFNYKRVFMALDYGGLYSLKSTNNIFLLKSAMFRCSIGVRF